MSRAVVSPIRRPDCMGRDRSSGVSWGVPVTIAIFVTLLAGVMLGVVEVLARAYDLEGETEPGD